MADNVTANPGTGGAVFATDDVAGVHYPITKITIGGLDSAGTLLTAGNGAVTAGTLRVTLASDSTGVIGVTDNGGSLTVDGTIGATQSGTWNITNISGTVSLPTGASTAALQSTANTALANIESAAQLIDDPVFADDAAFTLASSKVMMSGAIRVDTPSTLTAVQGDAVPLRVNSVGALHVSASGTVSATQSGTWNINNISGTVSLPTGAATSANQTTEITALQLIDNPIVAHDAAVSGSTGVNIAGFEARSTEPTAVGDADASRAITTLLGKQVVLPYAVPGSTWNYAAASGGITNTTGVTAKAAAGLGIRNYITAVQVVNGHATVSTDVQIRDGASGTVLWRGFAQAAGGGVSAEFDPPLRGSTNTLVEVACGTTGSATYFNLQGFVAAE